MCGIAGILNIIDSRRPADVNIMRRMLSIMRYRGPDETGIYLNKYICLGNVRLSIIDLKTGQQPLSDQSGNYWIVYNGEIFNYLELKEDLLKQGFHFKTNSDTEVVVQMYARYKESCLGKLNGQFSFAIWDKFNQELFLARDRLGIRPLFYHFDGTELTFGSEIKAILQNTTITPVFNYTAFKQLFTFWTTLSPYTVFKNIFEVPPGHYLKIGRKKKLKITRYWSMDVTKPFTGKIGDAANKLFYLLEDATRLRLRSDVQVAAYLSGGIDSTLTTYLIKSLAPGVLKTFSIGFEDREFDETVYQKEASTYLDTEHTELTCKTDTIGKIFPEVIWHTEMPLLRTSPAPMYLLSGEVGQAGIKVVITGEGADEILAGYDIFKEEKIRSFWSKYPDSRWRPELLKNLYSYIPAIKNSQPLALKLFYGYKLNETKNPFYSHLLRWHNSSRLLFYFHPQILHEIDNYNPLDELLGRVPENFTGWSGLKKAQYLETSIFMSGYLLSSQGDRMTMAHSVEGRYPFLDHRVIEYCLSLPDRYKLMGLNEKFILKKIATGRIPESIIRRPKQAYRAPIYAAFISQNHPEYVTDLLSKQSLDNFSIFDSTRVLTLIKKLKTANQQTEMNNMALIGIISTQLLYYLYIKKNQPFYTITGYDFNPKIINEFEI